MRGISKHQFLKVNPNQSFLLYVVIPNPDPALRKVLLYYLELLLLFGFPKCYFYTKFSYCSQSLSRGHHIALLSKVTLFYKPMVVRMGPHYQSESADVCDMMVLPTFCLWVTFK